MSNAAPTFLELFFQLQLEQAGILYPKRPTLSVVGGTVADDPANGVTTLTVGSSQVNSVLGLRTYAPAGPRQFIAIDGYTTPGDGGGGNFIWNATDVRADDSGTILKVGTIATGRWNRVYSGPLKVEWFGAVGDDSTDDTAAIELCDTAAQAVNGSILLTVTYKVSSPVLHARIRWEWGARLDVTGVAALYGPIEASPSQAIFTSTSSVRLFDQATASTAHSLEVFAAWWGAVGDWIGSSTGTDNTNAFRYALLCAMTLAKQSSGATGGKLRLGRGQFRCTDVPFTVLGDSTDGVPAWTASTNWSTVLTCVMSGGYLWGLVAAGMGSTTPPTSTVIGRVFVDGTAIWRCLAVAQPTGTFGASGVIIEGEDTGGGQPTQTAIVCDFAVDPAGATGDPSGTTGSVDGSGNFTDLNHTWNAGDVGLWIFVSTSATATNIGAWRIASVTSAHVVVLVDPTTEATWTADASATMYWTQPRRSAVRFWTRDCIARGFVVLPADGKGLYSGTDDTISPRALVDGGGGICSNNEFDSVVVTGNRSGATLLHGWMHSDNPITPNANFSTLNNCENTHYKKSWSIDWVGCGYYDPVNGEAKDILVDGGSTIYAPEKTSQNPRAAVYKAGGNIVLRGPTISSTQVGFFSGAADIECYDIASEGMGRLYKQPNNSGAPLNTLFVGGRIAVNGIASDGKMLKARGGNCVTLLNVGWDPVFIANFSLEVDNFDGGPIVPASLTAIGCRFPNATPFSLVSGLQTRVLAKNNIGVRDGSGVGFPVGNVEQSSSSRTLAAATTTQEEIEIPSGQQVTIKYRLTSRDTTTFDATHAAVQEIIGSFVNVAGTVTQVGSTQALFTAQGSGAIVASFAIAGAIVECQVTQTGTDTWFHVARVETEINF